MLAWVDCVVTVYFPALILIFSVQANRLAGNSVSDMSYLVLSGTLNVNSNTGDVWRGLSCFVCACCGCSEPERRGEPSSAVRLGGEQLLPLDVGVVRVVVGADAATQRRARLDGDGLRAGDESGRVAARQRPAGHQRRCRLLTRRRRPAVVAAAKSLSTHIIVRLVAVARRPG